VAGLIVAGVIAILVVIVPFRSVRIIPQARAGLVERLGRYHRTLDAGLAVVIPFVDRVLPLVDLREQVVSFPPQPVITEDNLVVSIDTVVYYQVTDAKAGDVRDCELHHRNRAAHGDHPAERHRRNVPRRHAHLP
jgi:regulator of protease activity HflC (stomatin/prohibitin superfamily)